MILQKIGETAIFAAMLSQYLCTKNFSLTLQLWSKIKEKIILYKSHTVSDAIKAAGNANWVYTARHL